MLMFFLFFYKSCTSLYKKIRLFPDVLSAFRTCLKIKYKVNAARKSKVDDNTAKMQSIKWLGV